MLSWYLLYFASVFFFPHQNPAPSIAIEQTPNGTPTPAPIATLVADLGESSILHVGVAVVVAEVPMEASAGSSEKVLSSLQQLPSDPQQYVRFLSSQGWTRAVQLSNY